MSKGFDNVAYIKKYAGTLTVNQMKLDINLNTDQIVKVAADLGVSLEIDPDKQIVWPLLDDLEKLVFCEPWGKTA